MASPAGMWTSVSGSMAQSQNIDTIANNIANANTVSFKKDEATFKEYLTTAERPQDPIVDIPRTAFKDSDFYHFDGREHAMVNLDKIHVNHTQGGFRNTNAPFDLAIDGPGFFAIQTPQGMKFTRAGDLKMNGQGQLVTTDGYAVLGIGAPTGDAPVGAAAAAPGASANPENPGDQAKANLPPPNPFDTANRMPAQAGQPSPQTLKPIVVVSENSKVMIHPDGQVYGGDELLGTLVLAEFPNNQGLQKIGSNLYENVDPANVPTPSKQSRIRQGFLEQSNVNTVTELVNLIKANRMFEGNMRAIRVYNDMAGKEANEVGKL